MVTEKRISYKILNVEPDSRRADIFVQTFDDLVAIETVTDVKEALTYLDHHPLTDLVIVKDGPVAYQFLKTLRSRIYLDGIKVILRTAETDIGLGGAPFRDIVIDVFPFNITAEEVQTRLNYLILKKQYESQGGSDQVPIKIWMPPGKRLFDIVVSFTVLLLLSPILLIVALLIRLDSKGPIFYSSKRVGTGYRIFDMYKFRTMRTDADQLLAGMASQNMYAKEKPKADINALCETCRAGNTPCQRPLFLDNQQVCEKVYRDSQKGKAMFMKFKEDPRVTRLGKILRNTSIDELPQLFNILKGDMSFVGNRPLPQYEAEKLTATGYARRFAAPAGLTGLWQVMKRGKDKVSDEERIQLDILYAKTYSFKTDLVILLKTVVALWQKENV